MTKLSGVRSAHPHGDKNTVQVATLSGDALNEDIVKSAIRGKEFTLKKIEKL